MNAIVVKNEYLSLIQDDKNFINSVQLGRILGAIQYNKIIYAKIMENENANTSIQLYLLLNHAALLFEGIKKFYSSKSDFEDLNFYKKNLDRIKIILSEAEDENSFNNKVLKKIRNRIVFHFDKGVIREVLSEFIDDSLKEKEDLILIQGETELVKDTAYLLSDNMNINYVLKSINGEKLSNEDKFKILSGTLLNLSELFCDILASIIPDLIEDYCEFKEL